MFLQGENPLRLPDLMPCQLCPELGKDHVAASGTIHTDVMVILGAPSKPDLEAGLPVQGVPATVFNGFLDQCGIDRETVYITHAVKCMPPHRKPGATEVSTCAKRWLKLEMEVVDPRVVVLVGAEAFEAVIPPGEGQFRHGEVIRSKRRTYLVMFHPNYFIKYSNLRPFIQEGERLRELLQVGSPLEVPDGSG